MARGSGASRHRWCAFGSVAVTDEELAAHGVPDRGSRATVRCHDCGCAWPESSPCPSPRRPGYPDNLETGRRPTH